MIDGGFFTPGESERLYQFLCAHSEGTPVIDAWFFSHAHQDHIGVFLDMMESHRRDLLIRKLIFDFQPLPLPSSSEGWREIQTGDLATVKRFYEVLEEYCADIPVQTPHTGDEWRMDELTIQVLYTHKDLDVNSTFNVHSTVIRVETAGWSVLFLGDVFTEGSRIMLANGPEKLKSDFVQVAHHGFSGPPRELYEAVNACAALWPSTKEGMEKHSFREANDYLLHHSNVKHHLVADDGIIQISFSAATEKIFF